MTSPTFLADEDLRGAIVGAVRRLEPGIDLVRAVDVGVGGKSDDDVLDYAIANGRIVISHDVSTMCATAERRIAAGQSIPGLILVRQAVDTRSAADDLVLIWSASQAEEWRNRIVFLPL